MVPTIYYEGGYPGLTIPKSWGASLRGNSFLKGLSSEGSEIWLYGDPPDADIISMAKKRNFVT